MSEMTDIVSRRRVVRPPARYLDNIDTHQAHHGIGTLCDDTLHQDPSDNTDGTMHENSHSTKERSSRKRQLPQRYRDSPSPVAKRRRADMPCHNKSINPSNINQFAYDGPMRDVFFDSPGSHYSASSSVSPTLQSHIQAQAYSSPVHDTFHTPTRPQLRSRSRHQGNAGVTTTVSSPNSPANLNVTVIWTGDGGGSASNHASLTALHRRERSSNVMQGMFDNLDDDDEDSPEVDVKIVERKLRKNVKNRLACIIRQTLNMNESVEQLVGCSMDKYRSHIERQFTPGMSWSNHGAWHIDHIQPLSKFKLVDPLERARAFHFSNTRPLWAHINLTKGTSPMQSVFE
jgi:hypothetical protein